MLVNLTTRRKQLHLFFIIEEILDSLRIKRGEDIDCDQSPEETEKDKNEVESDSSRDAEKNREDSEDQSLEKDSDNKALGEEPGQGKPEGKRITWFKRNILLMPFV